MADAANADSDSELPPPGSRWGNGAQSVLPFLTRTLQARPAATIEGREARGVEGPAANEHRSRPAAA